MEDIDTSSLTVKEKILHKNWKVRVLGYEELSKLCVSGTKTTINNKYIPLAVQFYLYDQKSLVEF